MVLTGLLSNLHLLMQDTQMSKAAATGLSCDDEANLADEDGADVERSASSPAVIDPTTSETPAQSNPPEDGQLIGSITRAPRAPAASSADPDSKRAATTALPADDDLEDDDEDDAESASSPVVSPSQPPMDAGIQSTAGSSQETSRGSSAGQRTSAASTSMPSNQEADMRRDRAAKPTLPSDDNDSPDEDDTHPPSSPIRPPIPVNGGVMLSNKPAGEDPVNRSGAAGPEAEAPGGIGALDGGAETEEAFGDSEGSTTMPGTGPPGIGHSAGSALSTAGQGVEGDQKHAKVCLCLVC